MTLVTFTALIFRSKNKKARIRVNEEGEEERAVVADDEGGEDVEARRKNELWPMMNEGRVHEDTKNE